MAKKKLKKKSQKPTQKQLTKYKRFWLKFAQFLLILISTIALVIGSVYIGLYIIGDLGVDYWAGILWIIASVIAKIGHDKIVKMKILGEDK